MAFQESVFGAEFALAELALAHHSERRRRAVEEGALLRFGFGSGLGLGLRFFRLFLLLQKQVVVLRLLVVVQDRRVRLGFRRRRHSRYRACAVAGAHVQRQVHHQVWILHECVWRDVVGPERSRVVELVAAVPQVHVAWRHMYGREGRWRQRHDGGDLQVLHRRIVRNGEGEGVVVADFDRELHDWEAWAGRRWCVCVCVCLRVRADKDRLGAFGPEPGGLRRRRSGHGDTQEPFLPSREERTADDSKEETPRDNQPVHSRALLSSADPTYTHRLPGTVQPVTQGQIASTALEEQAGSRGERE